MKIHKKVSIQGDIGSNHHVLAKKMFPNLQDEEVICAQTFDEVIQAVENESVPLGLLAIENSIAGSLHPNYQLLSEHGLIVIAEGILPIHHCLIGLSSAHLEDIRSVYSHEMALRQCEKFLRAHQIESREYFDTAAAAAFIARQADPTIAAIAPAAVAAHHNLRILAHNIETVANAHTRFLVVAKNKELVMQTAEKKKVMLEVTLPHIPGSLAHFLAILANAKCNVTKIESLPIIETPWEYKFYIDFCTTQPIDAIFSMIKNAQKKTNSIRIHGVFAEGKVYSL